MQSAKYFPEICFITRVREIFMRLSYTIIHRNPWSPQNWKVQGLAGNVQRALK